MRDAKLAIRQGAIEALRATLSDIGGCCTGKFLRWWPTACRGCGAGKRAPSWRLQCYQKIYKEAQNVRARSPFASPHLPAWLARFRASRSGRRRHTQAFMAHCSYWVRARRGVAVGGGNRAPVRGAAEHRQLSEHALPRGGRHSVAVRSPLCVCGQRYAFVSSRCSVAVICVAPATVAV